MEGAGMSALAGSPGPMKRLALLGLVALATVGGAVFALGASSPNAGGGTYKVRAIFDDASFAVPGEDVRIAGAPVGTIDSLDVTKGKKAAVTIEIDKPGFVPFHLNAHCSIRPQSLIG